MEQTKQTTGVKRVTFNDVFLSEKNRLYAEMEKKSPGWMLNKNIVKQIKKAAKTAAETTWYAVTIGRVIGEKPENVRRAAVLIRAKRHCGIQTAFDIIRKQTSDGKLLEGIVKDLI